MALKDLRSKIKEEPREDPNSSRLELDFPKLLEDKRAILYDVVAQRKELEWKAYFRRKAEGGDPFFKTLYLAMNFVVAPISLRKDLEATFPYYRRGTRGFLIDPAALNLFSPEDQIKIKSVMEEKGCKIVLFEHNIITLPPEYYRVLKKRS